VDRPEFDRRHHIQKEALVEQVHETLERVVERGNVHQTNRAERDRKANCVHCGDRVLRKRQQLAVTLGKPLRHRNKIRQRVLDHSRRDAVENRLTLHLVQKKLIGLAGNRCQMPDCQELGALHNEIKWFDSLRKIALRAWSSPPVLRRTPPLSNSRNTPLDESQ
jgi:hypothetical protein